MSEHEEMLSHVSVSRRGNSDYGLQGGCVMGMMSMGDALGKGSAGWVDAPCSRCGMMARWAASIARMITREILVLCESCMSDDVVEAYSRLGVDYVDVEDLIRRSGIPMDSPTVRVRDVFRGWVTGDASGLMLVGEIDAGKSTHAIQFVRDWCRNTQKRALYVNEVEMLDGMSDWEGRKEYLRRLHYTPLLVIDDIGTGKRTERTTGDLFNLIDKRSAYKRRTIFISNKTMGDLVSVGKVDERVAARIARMCGTMRRFT